MTIDRVRPHWRLTLEGALVTDYAYPGLTVELYEPTRASYGARYFIGESMSRETAQTIARAFEVDLVED